MMLSTPRRDIDHRWGDRVLESWRREDIAATALLLRQGQRLIPVLPGFSVTHPAVESRTLVDEWSMKADDRPLVDAAARLVMYLDGYERAASLDMALWRANA